MKKVGIVSYNMYGNFTNYGSALQSYALHRAIDKLSPGELQSVIVDYCPDVLADKDILNPFKNMWDQDADAQERCRLSMPAIKVNYHKFLNFYKNNYRITKGKYTSNNFNESLILENLSGYVCGSDTVFAVPEFGFDDGFYANYSVMRNRSVAYAASFGDYDIPEEHLPELKTKLNNFNAIALREMDKQPIVSSIFKKPLYKVVDPTLLLTPEEYNDLIIDPEMSKPYLLLYSRRANKAMDEFAEKYAIEHNLEIVEISLNASNANKNIMRYDAGVEEFLGLVKNAEIVVTNSFHGMIFAVQFKRPFITFSRKLCDTKIEEMLSLFGIEGRLFKTGNEPFPNIIDYRVVHNRINLKRRESITVLNEVLKLI